MKRLIIVLIILLSSNVYAQDTQKVSYTVEKIAESEKSIGDKIGYTVTIDEKQIKPNEPTFISNPYFYIYLYEADGKYIDEATLEGPLENGSKILTLYEYRSYGTGEPKIYKDIWVKYRFTFTVNETTMPETGQSMSGKALIVVGIFIMILGALPTIRRILNK